MLSRRLPGVHAHRISIIADCLLHEAAMLLSTAVTVSAAAQLAILISRRHIATRRSNGPIEHIPPRSLGKLHDGGERFRLRCGISFPSVVC